MILQIALKNPGDFALKIPRFEKAVSMKLSAQTHDKIESFFRLYFDDKNLKLPETQFFVRRGARLVTKVFAVNGVTVGKNVFIKPGLCRRDAKNCLVISKNLLVHELTHVLQYQKQGFFVFLFTYFKAYFANLKRKEKWDFNSRMEAYLEIPHEIEARDSAEKFVKQLK